MALWKTNILQAVSSASQVSHVLVWQKQNKRLLPRLTCPAGERDLGRGRPEPPTSGSRCTTGIPVDRGVSQLQSASIGTTISTTGRPTPSTCVKIFLKNGRGKHHIFFHSRQSFFPETFLKKDTKRFLLIRKQILNWLLIFQQFGLCTQTFLISFLKMSSENQQLER